MLKKIFLAIGNFVKYYIVFKGNRIKYLRSLGVRIGSDCQILNKPINYGSEPWLIEIGDKVTITYGVFLLTHDASSRLFRESLQGSSNFGNRFGAVRVLENCFIGINSIVMPGVTIGPNSIVGAGSVVIKDVPPNRVVAGVPAREISSLEEYIEKYKERMVLIKSTNREDLRKELTLQLWGEER
jgi:acetyltransferase-like isoleucine patch superfamily enzyme